MCFISGPSSSPFVPYGMALIQTLGVWTVIFLLVCHKLCTAFFSSLRLLYHRTYSSRAAFIVPWSCCRTFSSVSGPSVSQSWQPFVPLGNWARAIYSQVGVYCLQNPNRPTRHYAFFLVMEGASDNNLSFPLSCQTQKYQIPKDYAFLLQSVDPGSEN